MAMYRDHFGFQGKPFSIAPDPRFLFMSQRHREALAHLLYGIGEGGGFVQLTGEVGTGKTTVCRCLLEQLPDNVDVALILNPKLTALELVASVCDELRIEYPAGEASIKALIDRLNEHLLSTHSTGRRTVLIIDEAQNLSAEVLEQVRLLTNLETSQDKLLQIILIGQPELNDLLSLHEMRQLAQRITARYHLEALSKQETRDYVKHRLKVCGGSGQIFKPNALDEIHKLAGGVPRLINVLCDRALLGAYVESKEQVDRAMARRAAKEVKPATPASFTAGTTSTVWSWAAVLVVTAGLVWLFQSDVVRNTDTLSGLQEHAPPQVMLEESARDTVPMEDAASDAAEQAMELASENSLAEVAESESRTEPEVASAADMELAQVPVEETGFGLLLQQSGRTVWQRARRAILARWGIDNPGTVSGDTCKVATANKLGCLRGKSGWKKLRSLDRPALLELVTAAGRVVPLALQSVQGSTAKVFLDGDNHEVTIEDINRYWNGEYIILWKPPVAVRSLQLGDSGENVTWLRNSLAAILGNTADVPQPEIFDDSLQQQVRLFQKTHQLKQDGVAGKQTFLHINSATEGRELPRLLAASG